MLKSTGARVAFYVILCLYGMRATQIESLNASVAAVNQSSGSSAHEQIANAALESVKQRILDTLGITSIPVISKEMRDTASAVYAQWITKINNDKSSNDNKAVTRQVTVPAANSTSVIAGLEGLPILTFDFGTIPENYDVKAAKLLMYVRRNIHENYTTTSDEVNIEVFKITTSSPYLIATGEDFAINLTETSGKYVDMNVSQLVTKWFSSPQENHGIYINATGPGGTNIISLKHSKAPFIQVDIIEKKTRRTKRESAADNSTENCYRRPFIIDFEQIGWDFIIAPKQLNAFMCDGKCPLLVQPRNFYTYALSVASRKAPAVRERLCAPKEFKDLEFLFFNCNYTIVMGVGSLSVESCTCL